MTFLKLISLCIIFIGCAPKAVPPPYPIEHDCISVEPICTNYYGEEIVSTVKWAASEWQSVGGRDLNVEINSECPFKFTCEKLKEGTGGRANPYKVYLMIKEGFVFDINECSQDKWYVPTFVLHELGHFNTHKKHSSEYNVMMEQINKCEELNVPKTVDWEKVSK